MISCASAALTASAWCKAPGCKAPGCKAHSPEGARLGVLRPSLALVLPYILTPVYVSKYMGRQVWREAPVLMRGALRAPLVRSTQVLRPFALAPKGREASPFGRSSTALCFHTSCKSCAQRRGRVWCAAPGCKAHSAYGRGTRARCAAPGRQGRKVSPEGRGRGHYIWLRQDLVLS